MILRSFVLSAIVLAQLAALPARAQQSNAQQSNDTVTLSVGASTLIELSENPSTGYRWRIDAAQGSNLAIVDARDAGYQPSRSGLLGAPGAHRWRIRARAPGTARIVFAYSRPWERGAPAKIHAVEVRVAPGQ